MRLRVHSLILPLATSLCTMAAPALAGVDDLESIGPDLTPVTTRIIEGVTVTISTAQGSDLLARTYGVPPAAFLGSGGLDNVPLNPENISGERFISSSGFIGGFDVFEPIIFEFSEPVTAFGFTTIDLFEDGAPPTDFLSLRAFDEPGEVVNEHVRTGPWGPSGVDLDWFVSFAGGITKVHLTGDISINPGYGIDDLLLVRTPVSVERASWGGVKGQYR